MSDYSAAEVLLSLNRSDEHESRLHDQRVSEDQQQQPDECEYGDCSSVDCTAHLESEVQRLSMLLQRKQETVRQLQNENTANIS